MQCKEGEFYSNTPLLPLLQLLAYSPASHLRKNVAAVSRYKCQYMRMMFETSYKNAFETNNK